MQEYVYLERVKRRLSDMGQLEDRHVLYLLAEALHGVRNLAELESSSAFQLSEDMVSVTAGELVKVWFNKDTSLNHPEAALEEGLNC
jgi:DNA-directed RNA polymerase subunit F